MAEPLYMFMHPAQYDLLREIIGKPNYVRILQPVGQKQLTLEEYLNADAQR